MTVTTYAMPAGWGLLLQDMGLSPRRVFQRAGLPLDGYAQKDGRVGVAEYHRLWTAMAEEAAPRKLPLVIADSLSTEAFDPPLFAALCSPDLNRAATRIARYKQLIGPIRLAVAVEEHRTRLSMHWPVDAPPPAVFGQTELLFWVWLVRTATRAQVRPVEVRGPHPDDLSDYLGVPLRPGPTWELSFSSLDARRPFLTANEGMWDFFEPELRRRLDELTSEASHGERVRALLIELLPAGDVSMGAVARQLGASKRTLQRRLSGEGTTFQEVLNNTRESLARHYLGHSQLSAAEISFLLGYADPNSFYRAFHSWTGSTPETIRSRAAG